MLVQRKVKKPIRHSKKADPTALYTQVGDMAVLVRQLTVALRKTGSGSTLCDKAGDYLKRQGLQGSPLRTKETGL